MEREELDDLPLYIKAKDIYDTARALIETIGEEDAFHSREFLMSNASILSAKIAGAEGVDDYGIKMENAILIRIAAREMQAHTAAMLVENMSSKEYIYLLRNEINEFRILLKEWINSFDPTESEEWEWSISVKGDYI